MFPDVKGHEDFGCAKMDSEVESKVANGSVDDEQTATELARSVDAENT